MEEYPLLILLVYCPTFSSLISSGDSYTATCFDVRGPPPNDEEPFGNPEYPGLSYHEGPTWVANDIVQANVGGLSSH